jgi:hypothetical protein
MPNECMNTLSVMGEKENVEEFVKFVTTGIDKISLFNSLIPFPEELDDTTSPVNLADKGKNKELIEKYGSDNWYDWRVDNWGTKWGDYELTTSEITKAYNEEQWYINFNYTTAWSPGENELANAICKHFPKLKAMIQYEEPGMCFAGETLVLNGKIVRQDSWELNQLNESITEVYWPQYEQESE